MLDVLAIGPHPDDVELAAGGTVAHLVETGHRVGLVDLTRGERATRGTPALRESEATAAAAALGVVHRENLGIPDGGVCATDPGQLTAVVQALRRHQPRLVLTLHHEDDHPDHIEGGHLVERAVYLAGLRNYPDAGATPHRVDRLLFAMGRRPFTPSLIVDITPYRERKRTALQAYATQFQRDPDDPLVTAISEPGFLELTEARDRYYGHLINVRFGEPFRERGPVPVRDAANLLVPGRP